VPLLDHLYFDSLSEEVDANGICAAPTFNSDSLDKFIVQPETDQANCAIHSARYALLMCAPCDKRASLRKCSRLSNDCIASPCRRNDTTYVDSDSHGTVWLSAFLPFNTLAKLIGLLS